MAISAGPDPSDAPVIVPGDEPLLRALAGRVTAGGLSAGLRWVPAVGVFLAGLLHGCARSSLTGRRSPTTWISCSS